VSGDVFKSPGESIERFGDKASQYVDPSRNDTTYNLSGKRMFDRSSNWYFGPGGESATKIGLAALLAYAGGAVFGAAGAGGGEGGGSTSTGGAIPMYGNNALQMGQKVMGNAPMPSGQQQQRPNPLLMMMMQKQQQPTAQQPYTPLDPGVLSSYMRY
jgi:hypothetical protein